MAYFPNATFARDGNGQPITTDGFYSSDIQTLVGNNATVHVPIFTITGTVLVKGIWGVVTTVLGANHTAAFWRLNDATNAPAITLATGTTLSSANAGSVIVKKDLATAALTLVQADQGRVSEPTTRETSYFSPFLVNANGAVTTNIEYTYTTTDTPTSGVINFILLWTPVSLNAGVTAL